MSSPPKTCLTAAAVIAAIGVACSTPSETPVAPDGGLASSASALAASESPSPGTSPSPLPACPLGKGTLSGGCSRGAPMFLADVEAAIDTLAQDRPDIFDLGQLAGPGGFKVVKVDEYYDGVVRNLVGMGFCANFDLREIQVKNSNDFSEQYDVLLSTLHVRRGQGSYRATCSPAIFPVDPADFIDSVRVAFFGITCKNGKTPPRNGARELPVGCEGSLTATPKTKDNIDVDPRIHGPEILWAVPHGAERIRVEDFPGVAFNKSLIGLEPGEFSVCATVLNIQGCLHGQVTP